MEKIRTFIAVDIAEKNLFNQITEIKNSLQIKGAKFIKENQLHLTIHFLGDTDQQIIPKITSLLDLVNMEHFKITLKNIGVFPSPMKPRILWIGIQQEHNDLKILNNFLKKPLEELGFSLDTRPYSPHLTIARIKFIDTIGKQKIKSLIDQYKDYSFGTIPVKDIILKKSELAPSGAIYSDIYVKEL